MMLSTSAIAIPVGPVFDDIGRGFMSLVKKLKGEADEVRPTKKIELPVSDTTNPSSSQASGITLADIGNACRRGGMQGVCGKVYKDIEKCINEEYRPPRDYAAVEKSCVEKYKEKLSPSFK